MELSKPYHRTSILISPKMYELCKKHNVQFTEALRVGMTILLADKGIMEYSNELNLVRNMTRIKEQLEEMSQKYYDIKERS